MLEGNRLWQNNARLAVEHAPSIGPNLQKSEDIRSHIVSSQFSASQTCLDCFMLFYKASLILGKDVIK